MSFRGAFTPKNDNSVEAPPACGESFLDALFLIEGCCMNGFFVSNFTFCINFIVEDVFIFVVTFISEVGSTKTFMYESQDISKLKWGIRFLEI